MFLIWVRLVFFFLWLAYANLRSNKHRLNYTKVKDEDFMDRSDETIRIAASQFRCLKKNQVDYMRSVKRMGQEEKKLLMQCLL